MRRLRGDRRRGNAGAYDNELASQFHIPTLPAEVALTGEGIEVGRRRETMADVARVGNEA